MMFSVADAGFPKVLIFVFKTQKILLLPISTVGCSL